MDLVIPRWPVNLQRLRESDHINVDLDNTMDLERLNNLSWNLLKSSICLVTICICIYIYIDIYVHMSIDVEDVCQSAISIKFVPALFNISIPLGRSLCHTLSWWIWSQRAGMPHEIPMVRKLRCCPELQSGCKNKAIVPQRGKPNVIQIMYIYIYIIKYMVLWGSMCTMQVVQKLAYT